MRVTLITSLLLSALAMTTSLAASGSELLVRLGGVKTIGSDEGIPFVPKSFCVGEKSNIYVPNHLSGAVVVLEKNSEGIYNFKNTLREKYLEPSVCAYYSDGKMSILSVIDYKAKKLYARQQTLNGENILEFPVRYAAYDARISQKGDSIIIAGYEKDTATNQGYELYALPLKGQSQNVRYLLAANVKYQLTPDEYSKTENKLAFSAIGVKAILDVNKNNALYSWSGNLSLLLINTENGQFTRFGHTTRNYKKPEGENLAELYKKQQFDELLIARAKFSTVTSVFFSNQYIYAVYSSPVSGNVKKPSYFLQRYTSKGQYVNEAKLPGKPSDNMYFDKQSKTLFCLTKVNENKVDRFAIQSYQIVE